MTKLMIAKIDDFKMTTNRIQSVLKDDISTDYNVLDLAYKYLKMSDHKGPGMSKKTRRNLLAKVDSLEQLAKRLNGGQDPISTDVKKVSSSEGHRLMDEHQYRNIRIENRYCY